MIRYCTFCTLTLQIQGNDPEVVHGAATSQHPHSTRRAAYCSSSAWATLLIRTARETRQAANLMACAGARPPGGSGLREVRRRDVHPSAARDHGAGRATRRSWTPQGAPFVLDVLCCMNVLYGTVRTVFDCRTRWARERQSLLMCACPRPLMAMPSTPKSITF